VIVHCAFFGFVAAVVVIVVADMLVLQGERWRIGPVVHHGPPKNAIVDEGIDAVGIGEVQTLGDTDVASRRGERKAKR
jgi:hypothetical protein